MIKSLIMVALSFTGTVCFMLFITFNYQLIEHKLAENQKAAT